MPRRLFGPDWAGAWLFTWCYFGLARILRWGGRWRGGRGPGDVATLPLLGCALWLCFAALGPLSAWRAREAERRADRRALVLTGDPASAIRLQVRLARANCTELDPPTWAQWLWSRHPSPAQRIATARWYAVWLHARGRGRGPNGSTGPGRRARADGCADGRGRRARPDGCAGGRGFPLRPSVQGRYAARRGDRPTATTPTTPTGGTRTPWSIVPSETPGCR